MIHCSEYDYIEIVCIHRYPIKLTMKTGEVITGIALDTQYNKAREECIKVSVKGIDVLVTLDELAQLKICIKNPHFQIFSFT